MLCRAKRDHIAAQCPGHFCHKCHEHGHWARDCPRNTQCRWCHSNEHQVEECPLGGRTFTTMGGLAPNERTPTKSCL
ncbi:hypothetical protein EB796_022939 [Bugula neritina]|uniref:CCHC-type domain-containing protein n=1 Tax=Bugula neritina TaxID=10212 RepID=A0A7J7IXZ7_BUGNE|nr:hypothetical protein EB796_022939 [Bugula neritina]